MKAIGYIAVTFVMAVYSVIIHGWALSKLWAWFIVPTFALPYLSITAAIGIGMVVGFMAKEVKPTQEKRDFGTVLIEGFLLVTFKVGFFLLFGAVVKSWM